jgi:hypothetical protein
MAASHPEGLPSGRLAILVLGVALLGAGAMLYYHLGLFMPRVREMSATRNLAGGYSFGLDFYPIWLTSRECVRSRQDPYSAEVTRGIQRGIFGRALDSHIATDPPTDYRTFAYPAFTDLLFWPAAQVPFPTVRVILLLGLIVSTIASVFLWLRALSLRVSALWSALVVLLVLCSYPVLEGLYAGQLGLLVGLLLAAAMFALRRGRLSLAGTLLAITAIKPQMTVLVAFYFLVWAPSDWPRRRRLCVGLVSTTVVLVVAALVVWPYWIQSWVQVVLGYHRYANPPLVSEVLARPLGPALDRAASWALTGALLMAAVVLAWRNRAASVDSTQFWMTLSLLLSITAVTLLPGQAIHDQVILLPGIFLVSFGWRELRFTGIGKALLWAGAGLVLWPWVSAFGLLLLRPWLGQQEFYSRAIFSLPLRTAAAFPFVILGVLALSLRRANSGHTSHLSVPA